MNPEDVKTEKDFKELSKAEKVLRLESIIRKTNEKIQLLFSYLQSPQTNETGKRTIDIIVGMLNNQQVAIILFMQINSPKFIKAQKIFQDKIDSLHLEIWLLSWLQSLGQNQHQTKETIKILSLEIGSPNDRQRPTLRAFARYLVLGDFESRISQTHQLRSQELNIFNNVRIAILKNLTLKYNNYNTIIISNNVIIEMERSRTFYVRSWERIERNFLGKTELIHYLSAKIKIFSNINQLISKLSNYRQKLMLISLDISQDNDLDRKLNQFYKDLKEILIFINYKGYDTGIKRLGQELDTILSQVENNQNEDFEID